MRHVSRNVHEPLRKFPKYFSYFHRKINGQPVKIRDSEIKGVITGRSRANSRVAEAL